MTETTTPSPGNPPQAFTVRVIEHMRQEEADRTVEAELQSNPRFHTHHQYPEGGGLVILILVYRKS